MGSGAFRHYLKCAPCRTIFQFGNMNSKNCSALKSLAINLVETYGQKETENNWNESALVIRQLSSVISSNPEKLAPHNENVQMIINVLEQSVL